MTGLSPLELMMFGMAALLLAKRIYDLYRGPLSKTCNSCGWRLSHAPDCPSRKRGGDGPTPA